MTTLGGRSHNTEAWSVPEDVCSTDVSGTRGRFKPLVEAWDFCRQKLLPVMMIMNESNLRSLTKTYVHLGKQKVLAMLSLYKAHLPCWLSFTIYDICNWWGPTDVCIPEWVSLSLSCNPCWIAELALSNLSHCSYRTTISSVDGSV
jgi:hypothetical protein